LNPLSTFVYLILHLQEVLPGLIQTYGALVYLILFFIIFSETGFVVTPFLPGDSLLFVAGALAAVTELNPWVVIASLALAAVLGDSLNYWIGHTVGKRFLERVHLVRPRHLAMAEQYYRNYGAKTIVIGRFIPVVRTIVPFLAGMGSMPYPQFLTYNIIGGVAWVLTVVLFGFYFGNIPLVKENFSIVVYLAVVLSLITIALIIRAVIVSGSRR
jgi:membrane-associated protein